MPCACCPKLGWVLRQEPCPVLSHIITLRMKFYRGLELPDLRFPANGGLEGNGFKREGTRGLRPVLVRLGAIQKPKKSFAAIELPTGHAFVLFVRTHSSPVHPTAPYGTVLLLYSDPRRHSFSLFLSRLLVGAHMGATADIHRAFHSGSMHEKDGSSCSQNRTGLMAFPEAAGFGWVRKPCPKSAQRASGARQATEGRRRHRRRRRWRRPIARSDAPRCELRAELVCLSSVRLGGTQTEPREGRGRTKRQ